LIHNGCMSFIVKSLAAIPALSRDPAFSARPKAADPGSGPG
jgi:hypothetical protein